jgi:hypothetical protein
MYTSRVAAEDHAAFPFDGSSPFDSTSPRKRWVPPGWDVNTTITSHGLKPSEIAVVDSSRCQNHRQRYPEVEAIVQMFFRVCAVILNIIVLIIVCLLDTNLDNIMPVKKLYGVVSHIVQNAVLGLMWCVRLVTPSCSTRSSSYLSATRSRHC